MTAGKFVDSNTGELRIIGKPAKPLRTAVEAVTPEPTAPAPEPLPAWTLDPAKLKARAGCLGTVEKSVPAEILQGELMSEFRWLETFAPAAAEIRAELVAGEAAKANATARLETLAGLAHDLENEIRHRAGLRAHRAEAAGQLASAKTALASPGCLERPDAELLRLELETKHLPARLAELESEIATSTARVERLLADSGADRARFLATLVKAARGTGVYAADPRALEFHSKGFLTV